LGALQQADKRPRQAIETYTQLLDDQLNEAGQYMVHQRRAEAYLSIGMHKEAIADYEEAIKLKEDDSSLLNNYAWLLATSPEDSIRNAKRSIELGTKACELTEFKKAHILSTLAAGYAEAGEWDKAVEWSTKAVEAGSDEAETAEQLKKELESYKEKKPWREKQDLQENDKKIEQAAGDLET
jgi:Tfp pilus assembly protein PilF